MAQLSGDADEEVGTYVAKVVENPDAAETCLRAYNIVRPFTLKTPHLAKLCETGRRASPDQIAALLEWIDGTPLSEIAGYITVYAEEQTAIDPDKLALRWIEQIL